MILKNRVAIVTGAGSGIGRAGACIMAREGATVCVADRDEMIAYAANQAWKEARTLLGGDTASWRWDRIHTLTLRNASLGESGVAPIEWLFNRGPWALGGGSSIVDATGWDASVGYEVDRVPSMRMVVDLSDFDKSTWINLTGASGHAFDAHYTDQTDLWATNRTRPWPFTSAAIKAADRAAIASDAARVTSPAIARGTAARIAWKRLAQSLQHLADDFLAGPLSRTGGTQTAVSERPINQKPHCHPFTGGGNSQPAPWWHSTENRDKRRCLTAEAHVSRRKSVSIFRRRRAMRARHARVLTVFGISRFSVSFKTARREKCR